MNLPKPLWVLNLAQGTWSEKSPSGIGWERGFYDYTPGSSHDQTADAAFQFLENNVPTIRDHIRNEGFACWVQFRKVLVNFVVMMAVRSPLFRKRVLSEELPPLSTGSNGNDTAKDSAITRMVNEMQRVPHDWHRLDWVLRHTSDPENPFLAGDQVVGMTGSAPTLEEAVQMNDYWLYCPLSWDMCLIGSSRPLNADLTAPHEFEHITKLQTLIKQRSQRFLASPVQISHLTSG